VEVVVVTMRPTFFQLSNVTKELYLGIIHTIRLGKTQAGHVLKSFLGGERKWISLESHPMGFQGQGNHESGENVYKVLEY
jgi:hypothetical protein